jgi:DNA-binding NarL/FixJ family response regulator
VSDRLRLVLVDDHAVVRDGLRALLSTFDDLEVVGEASSGEEALRVVDSTGVDVVLMDLEMPGMGGIEATRALTARHPKLVVLVLTMYGEDETVMSAIRAGARGYLLKGARRDDVIRTIHGVSRGDAIFGAEVAARLLDRVRTDVPQASPFPTLTRREHDVLALLADGKSNSAIARHLGLSSRTVANHVSNILAKLNATDRADAAIQARQAGMGTR